MIRDRRFFWIFVLIWAAGLSIAAFFARNHADDFSENCEAAGGKTISTRSESVCLKKEAFVEEEAALRREDNK